MNLKQQIINATGRAKVKLIREFKALKPRDKIKVLREFKQLESGNISSDLTDALNKIKTLLLNPDATEKEYKEHLPLVELIEEHEDDVKDSDLYMEVMELLDADKVSMDSLFTTSE